MMSKDKKKETYKSARLPCHQEVFPMEMLFLLGGGLLIVIIAVVIAVVSSVVSAVAADQDDGEE